MHKHVQLTLPNDAVISIETAIGSTEKDVGFFETTLFNSEDLRRPLEGLAQLLKSALEKVKPDKAAVELGLELGVESGQLTTLLVKGASKAHVKITMEWTRAEVDKTAT